MVMDLAHLHYLYVQFCLIRSGSRAKQMKFFMKLGGDDINDK